MWDIKSKSIISSDVFNLSCYGHDAVPPFTVCYLPSSRTSIQYEIKTEGLFLSKTNFISGINKTKGIFVTYPSLSTIKYKGFYFNNAIIYIKNIY